MYQGRCCGRDSSGKRNDALKLERSLFEELISIDATTNWLGTDSPVAPKTCWLKGKIQSVPAAHARVCFTPRSFSAPTSSFNMQPVEYVDGISESC